MDVSELGEFGLIQRLQHGLGAPADDRLIIGIGDDAAVWRDGDGYTIATTDTMVENVHFLSGKVAWRDVGWKALAANVSDIAAMGGRPSFALVTLCLPPEMPVEHVDALYAGLRDCADAYALAIVGGDIVSSPFFAVTVALTGDAELAPDGKPLLLRRNAAQPGDLIAVTGPLGGSVGGLRSLTEGDARVHPTLVDAHMHFWPRIDAGQCAVRAGIRCGIDVSDGLVQDLGHICEASQVGAEVKLADVPLNATMSITYPNDAALMAATGGEDYELILIGSQEAIAAADAALRKHLDRDTEQLHVIGRITTGHNVVHVLDKDGGEIELASKGWDHLKRGSL